MAVADLGVTVADAAYQRAAAQLRVFGDDPVGYLIRVSRRVGVVLVAAGAIMGATGWFLKAAATTAANNELNVVENIGTIFSNIKAPNFQAAATGTAPVLGPNPISDIQNFFGDSWSDIQSAGSDIAQIGAVMGTLGEDVGQAIIDFAKAVLAFVTHFPSILWNALVWGVGGAIADILNWLFAYLIVFGILLLAISLVASATRWAWQVTVSNGLRAASAKLETRVAARSEAFWDVIFGNYRHAAAVAVAPTPVVTVASEAPSASQIAGTAPPEPLPAAPEAPAAAPAPPESPAPPAAAVSEEPAAAPPAEAPAPATNGTTEQTEQLLGGVPPPGWTQQDVNEYLAKAEPETIPEPSPEPVYLTGKDAAARADELLA